MSRAYLVAVYECHQAYGGPEEGGWWYDTGELVRVVKVFRDKDAAYAYRDRLNDRLDSRKFGPNQGRRAYYSVLSEGEARARVYKDCAPQHFPTERPYYE